MSYNYRFEPPTHFDDPSLEYGDNCHNCDNDCPGIFNMIYSEGDDL